MSRVSHVRLVAIAEGMSGREREIAQTVDRLRLVSHAQFARLIPPDPGVIATSAARGLRRTLRRLTDDGVLARLERRVGGVRAGSSGHVYYLGPVGQRVIAYWNGDGLVRGRVRPEPGAPFVRHRLSVTELYVALRERTRAGELDLMVFDVEPDCWRSGLSGLGAIATLKPDAFVRLGLGAYEDRWFVEVDLGTESRPVLRRKLQAYIDYFHSGAEQAAHGVFPRVLWLTTSEARKATLVDLCAGLPEEHWPLFCVNVLSAGAEVMAEQLEHDTVTGAGGGMW